MNRLAESRSPYLRQHAGNPVAWQPWDEAAWAQAAAEDKPVFLSVGYSACHWCHVMAHESFEDEEVAEALNRSFVSIKLDREERPDLDDVYMVAVQVASGHGGWPMSVFLTPDAKPFFAGTYFPKHGRHGRPGFLQVVHALADAWQRQRADVEASAEEFARAVRAVLDRGLVPSDDPDPMALAAEAVRRLQAQYDSEHGGFGGAPKFPPHGALRLFQAYARREDGGPELRAAARSMAEGTLEAMRRGGIYDHVGGGFHRYATDSGWHLPHFEKMLSDNALMLRWYAGSEGHAAVAAETADWIAAEMTDAGGWLYCALDADTGGEEGASYVWRWAELEAALGAGLPAFAEAFGCRPGGNFDDEATGQPSGANVLHLAPGAVPDPTWLDALRVARAGRPAPGLDDKGVAVWNALAACGLFAAGRTEQALRVCDAWAGLAGPGLPRVLGGEVPGFLEDFAALADAFFDAADATGEPRYRELAEGLVEAMVGLFGPADGPMPVAQPAHKLPLGMPRPVFDAAGPPANALAIRALRRAGRLDQAWAVALGGAGLAERAPEACCFLLAEMLEFGERKGGMPARARQARVSVRLVPQEPRLGPDGVAEASLVVEVPPGHTLNSTDPGAAWLAPLELGADGVDAEAGFPEAPAGGFEGSVEIALRLRGAAGTEFALRLRTQICSESECLAPEETEVVGRLV